MNKDPIQKIEDANIPEYQKKILLKWLKNAEEFKNNPYFFNWIINLLFNPDKTQREELNWETIFYPYWVWYVKNITIFLCFIAFCIFIPWFFLSFIDFQSADKEILRMYWYSLLSIFIILIAIIYRLLKYSFEIWYRNKVTRLIFWKETFTYFNNSLNKKYSIWYNDIKKVILVKNLHESWLEYISRQGYNPYFYKQVIIIELYEENNYKQDKVIIRWLKLYNEIFLEFKNKISDLKTEKIDNYSISDLKTDNPQKYILIIIFSLVLFLIIAYLVWSYKDNKNQEEIVNKNNINNLLANDGKDNTKEDKFIWLDKQEKKDKSITKEINNKSLSNNDYDKTIEKEIKIEEIENSSNVTNSNLYKNLSAKQDKKINIENVKKQIEEIYQEKWLETIYTLYDTFLENVDIKSFEIISRELSKDKNYVYNRFKIVEWADSETFKEYYFSNENKFPYYKDKNFYYQLNYWLFSKVDWIDYETFSFEKWFQKDKNNIYIMFKKSAVKDPKSFKYFWEYSIDKESIYIYSNLNLVDIWDFIEIETKISLWDIIDKNNFKYLWNNYFSDLKNIVYIVKTMDYIYINIKKVDIDSFEVISDNENYDAKDKNNFYLKWKIINFN